MAGASSALRVASCGPREAEGERIGVVREFVDGVCGIDQSCDFKMSVGVELVTDCDRFLPSSGPDVGSAQGQKRAGIG